MEKTKIEKETTLEKNPTSILLETSICHLGPKDRILTASLALFVEQGYFNTNVLDISKISQASVGSIYHHFANKEEIASSLYNKGIKLFREALYKSIEKEKTLENIVKQLIIGFLSFAEEHKKYSQYLWLSRHAEYLSNQVSVPTQVGFDKLGRKLTKALKTGIRKGEIKETYAEIIWSLIFGIPISFIRDWLDGHTKQSPSKVSNDIANRCWIALVGVSVET